MGITRATRIEKILFNSLGWICRPGVNTAGRRLWRLLRPFAPKRYQNYFPVSGEYTSSLPSGRSLTLISPGLDWYSAVLHWGGIISHEPDTVRLINLLAPSCRVFFDIGANIGAMGLFVACEHPQCQVYAFEPVPHIYDRLMQHVGLNNVTNIQAYNVALSNRPGRFPIFVPKVRWNTSRDASLSPSFRRDCYEVNVDATTIDDFVKNQSIKTVDIMKIDAETHEPEILEGAISTLKRHRPLIICEVLYGHTEQYLSSILDSLDYKLYPLSQRMVEQNGLRGDPNYVDRNFFFVPSERVESVGNMVEPEFEIAR